MLTERLASQVREAFRSFDEVNGSLERLEERKGGSFNQADFDLKRAKTSYRFSKLCDRMLRKMESSASLLSCITDSLETVQTPSLETKGKKKQAQYEALACTTIKLSF